MMFLIAWYLILCFVTMPLDSRLSHWHRWHAPPIATLLYVVNTALLYKPSESDIAEGHAAAMAFRALPVEWQWIIGFVVIMPVLWQVAGAGAEWKAMRRRNVRGGKLTPPFGGTVILEPSDPQYAEFDLGDGSTVLIEKCK